MKKLISIILLVVIILSMGQISFAKESTLTLQISEDFKNWENLSEEEKNKTIMPMATINNIAEEKKNNANSLLFGVQNFFTKAVIPSKYSLTEDINIPVKNQGTTYECWAISMASVLESYLAISGEKDIIPRYSARHMDYATTQTFLDGTNTKGFNRELGSGGNATIALGYLTNGTGAVLDEDMPFEDNEDKINLSEIENIKPATRVTDAVVFPNINKIIDADGNVTYVNDNNQEYTNEEVTLMRNNIKEYIMENGALSGATVGSKSQYYSNPSDIMSSEAYYCDSNEDIIDHAITIVGWDDNYSVDNFNSDRKPKNPGAYICLNSYGTDNFDNGYIYISYDDVNIEKNLTGITGTEDYSDDMKIYQNDFYGATLYLGVNPQGAVGMANVFTKEGDEDQYIDQIQVAARGNIKAEVYINPSDGNLDSSSLQKVEVDAEELDGNYNTLKLKNPIKITGNKFAVAVKLNDTESFTMGVECNYKDANITNSATIFDNVSANPGESYISLDGFNTWTDFTELQVGENAFTESNLCVKAITTTDAPENPDTNPDQNTDEKPDANPDQDTDEKPDTNPDQNTNEKPDTNTEQDQEQNNDQNSNNNQGENQSTGSDNNTEYYYTGKKDPTVANGMLPKTGSSRILIYIIFIGVMILIISYTKYRKYKDVN